MNQPATETPRPSPPWLLIGGLLLGAALVVFIARDSILPAAKSDGPIVQLTDANWQREVVESDIPVFVDFTAEWCGPCRAFAPTVAKLAKKYQGKIKVAQYDLGDRGSVRKMAEQHDVRLIPHVMIFKNGRPVNFQQTQSEAELVRIFDGLLASN
jgi:thioredoxin 1